MTDDRFAELDARISALENKMVRLEIDLNDREEALDAEAASYENHQDIA